MSKLAGLSWPSAHIALVSSSVILWSWWSRSNRVMPLLGSDSSRRSEHKHGFSALCSSLCCLPCMSGTWYWPAIPDPGPLRNVCGCLLSSLHLELLPIPSPASSLSRKGTLAQSLSLEVTAKRLGSFSKMTVVQEE